MRIRRNPVQGFIRNAIRLVIAVPLWLWIALPDFVVIWGKSALDVNVAGRLVAGVVKSIIILWVANIIAKMFYILPQWERLVLLRLGKSVGARGPAAIPVMAFGLASVLRSPSASVSPILGASETWRDRVSFP